MILKVKIFAKGYTATKKRKQKLGYGGTHL